MSSDSAIDNRARQSDELLALEAIFGGSSLDMSRFDSDHSFVLQVPLDTVDAHATLYVHFPETYPSSTPPEVTWIKARDTHGDTLPEGTVYPARALEMTPAMFAEATEKLRVMWEEEMGRDVVVFSWIAWIGEFLETKWPHPPDPIALPHDSDAPKASGNQTECVADESADEMAPVIYTGPAIERKKSVFVGHVARVTSADEVAAVKRVLMRDRKIAQASHNMSAYRIKLANGSVSQDNDDDGETAAGNRLGLLLQLVGVEDVVVVVSRWYGGVKLGPERFKLINNAARMALEGAGLVDAKNAGGSKKK